MKRSYRNASQEVKFAWQQLNSLNMTNQWALIDPKQGYGNLGVFSVNFWKKKSTFAEGHPQCWVLVPSHSKAQVHKGMREEVSLFLQTLPRGELG